MISVPNESQYKRLFIALALILVFHSLNLPVWVVILSGTFGAWRYLILHKNWQMPKILVLAPITILIGLGILITFKGQFGRDTCLSMLIAMLALKLLETKSRRDYLLVVVLGYFLIGNLFYFNQSFFTLLVSIVLLALLTSALIQICLKTQAPAFFSLKLSGKMLIQALPLTLILFVLFPRISGPIWSLQHNAHGGIGLPGLSESIKINQVIQNAMDDSVAFRVKFNGKPPPQNQLYWRGPVLWTNVNDEWSVNKQQKLLSHESLSIAGKAVEYSITLEPHKQKWLLMLDMPSKIPEFAKLTHDYSVIAKEPIVTRTSYNAVSFLEYRLGAEHLSKRTKKFSLQLNYNENPLTIALGQQWRNLNDQDKVNTALKLFKENGFYYTLNPPASGTNSIDDFMFKTKRGFCEHFAIAFVTLMRAADLPARVVTGYQGGEINPHDDFLTVRQMDAHAWAEVWLKDQGWVRVDPTASVSPLRIERGLFEAVQSAKPVPGQSEPETSHLPMSTQGKEFTIIKNAFLRWESLDNAWNQWIIGYNQKKQERILSGILGKKITTQTMVIWLIFTILLLGLTSLMMIYIINHAKQTRAQKLYKQFLIKLQRLELQPKPYEPAIEFAARVSNRIPNHQNELMAIAKAYNALRYSKHGELSDSSLIYTLENMIRHFNPRLD